MAAIAVRTTLPVTAVIPQAIAVETEVGMAVVIEAMTQKPNQAPEPTAMLVTPRAGARVAPSTAVAHL